MMVVNRMTLALSGYSLVPLATLKAAFGWTPALLQPQKQHKVMIRAGLTQVAPWAKSELWAATESLLSLNLINEMVSDLRKWSI